jgi:hypothetical protein
MVISVTSVACSLVDVEQLVTRPSINRAADMEANFFKCVTGFTFSSDLAKAHRGTALGL